MDAERMRFVTGTEIDSLVADGWDLDDLVDADSRQVLYDELFGADGDPLDVAARAVVANQVLDDEPPVTWQTVQRLTAAGLDRDEIFGQLATVMLATLQTMLAEQQVFDPEHYAAELARLPLPTIAALEQLVLATIAADQGIGVDALRDAVRADQAIGDDDAVAGSLVTQAIENLMLSGRMHLLAGDRAVAVTDLLAGSVLTLHISADEDDRGLHRATFDLAAFARQGEVQLPLWLSELDGDTDIAARLGADGTIAVEVLDQPPAVDDALVDRLLRVYASESAQDELPVFAEGLMLALVLEDRATFATPQAPLGILCQAAGLELRGDQAGHDESVWQHQDRFDRMYRVIDAAGDDEALWEVVGRVIDIADLASGQVAANLELGPVDDDLLRSALTDLEDVDALGIVAGELAMPDIEAWAQPFVDGLRRAARKPRHLAIAHYLAARRAEGADDAPAAVEHLERGYDADHNFTAGTDRLAWYTSIRGDAPTAVRLWRQCPPIPVIQSDLDVLDRLLERAATDHGSESGEKPGRNDPCWCGSGRKFKQCHLDVFAPPALPDRIHWVLRKAVGYVERNDAARETFAEVIYSRVEDMGDEDAIDDALEDPLMVDLVLTEGGWLERFVDAMRDLLPADEAELLRSWLPIERTVYEALAVRPGDGMTVRDLRTGDEREVREATFSRQVAAGVCFCGRVVPDSETFQFVGGIFTVPPGFEEEVFALLDERDPRALAEFSAIATPPTPFDDEDGALADAIDLREWDRVSRSRRR